MHNKNFTFAALTKLIMAITASIAALYTTNLYSLATLTILELACALIMKSNKNVWRGIIALAIFSALLILIQFIFSKSLFLAIGSAYKMFIMAVSLFILVGTTATQSITASLVKQCHLSYEYAFMITAVLRFVPDLLKESKEVRQAQTCRGFHPSFNPVRRIIDYMLILKPLVFKAIRRSEDMATSLSLRGFNGKGKRTFMASTQLHLLDYTAILINLCICIAAIKYF